MILDRILEAKRQEVAQAKIARPHQALREAPLWKEARRGFASAIRTHAHRCVIAEIKKASPSRGVIRETFDPASHAAAYERAGATCLSVLTDARFFGGSLGDLAAARRACALPLLRKDFVIDAYQIDEARAWGADAVLLIVAALDATAFAELYQAAGRADLDVLTEVHTGDELEQALAAGATLIGINNRNLHTFATSLDVTRELVRRVPAGVTVISESGFRRSSELAELEALGVHGFLIGEQLMAAVDPGAALAELLDEP